MPPSSVCVCVRACVRVCVRVGAPVLCIYRYSRISVYGKDKGLTKYTIYVVTVKHKYLLCL